MTADKNPSTSRLPSRGHISPEVVDGLPMPILVSRLGDDRVIQVNREFTEAYGYVNEAAVGTAAADLHWSAEDRVHTLDRQAGGAIESVEVRLRSADGDCCWAQADVSRFEMDGQDVILTTFYDIGDRKQAQATMSEMARFPDMNPGPVLRLDPDGIIRRYNEATVGFFGADLADRCFWDLCTDFPEASRARVAEGGEPVREDCAVGDRWLRLTVTRPPESDQVFVFGTDVTQQKLAEQELAERARFPAMNPGPVFRLDSEGRVVRANPAAAGLFGRESLTGLSWLELCPEVDQDLWARVFAEQAPVQHEVPIGEQWFSFVLRHEPVANQVFVYGSEMTRLKAAERALAELARFPEMNPGPVCRLDREGTVLLANRAATSVFDSEGLVGRSWLDLVPEAAPEWERILSSSEARVVEAKIGTRHLVLTHAPGPEGLFIFVYGTDITREKEAERVLRQTEKMATLGTLAAGVAHELNNPAAAAQRAAEQLQTVFAARQGADLELGAAGVVAEARSLLTALAEEARRVATGSSGLTPMERADAEAEVEDWLDENGIEKPWELAPVLVEAGKRVGDLVGLRESVGERHLAAVVRWQADTCRAFQLMEEIRHGSGRISEIVGAMKSYSYLGQAPIQSVDVNEGLRSTLVILRSKLKTGVTVLDELSDDIPRIEAYGGELNQVWTNLIDNAVSAMNGEGRIRLTSMLRGDRVVVSVEDDGPGIPADQQPRVFDAFYTTKPPGEGTGLGLHTTYSIVVEKHGGTIGLDSEPGRTRFTVELPLTPVPAGAVVGGE